MAGFSREVFRSEQRPHDVHDTPVDHIEVITEESNAMPPILTTLKGSARAAAVLTTLAATTPAFAAGSPTGVWIDDSGRGAIEISSCGKALCGKVVWVKSARDKSGCGESILGGVRDQGGGRWDGGWIYSPEHGRKFDVELTPVGADKLRVLGYAGIKMFGETHTWKRAPANLERCDGKEIAKDAPPAGSAPTSAAPTNGQPVKQAAVEPAPVASVAPTAAPQPEAKSPVDAADPAAAKPKPAAAPDASSQVKDPGVTDAIAADNKLDGEPDTARTSSGSGSGRLSIDKVLKKTANGRCKLDLPWAKFTFDCKEL